MTDFRYDTVSSTPGPEGVRIIALNRPESLNAMNRALIDDVARAFDDANADPATRAIVFTGTGKAFCAGDGFLHYRAAEVIDTDVDKLTFESSAHRAANGADNDGITGGRHKSS